MVKKMKMKMTVRTLASGNSTKVGVVISSQFGEKWPISRKTIS